MPDWPRLEHAYGSAADVPAILAALTPDTTNGAWDDLWSRICHQGTVYSSSFAALAPLCDLASRWDAQGRVMPLALSGAIVSADDVKGDREQFLREAPDSVRRLSRLAQDTLQAADGLSDADFVYLVEAALALGGDALWGRKLNHLNDGEFPAACPACGDEVYVVIGKYGFFLTAQEWVNRPDTARQDIFPADPAALTGSERWLYDSVAGAGRAQLATWLLYAFGRAACPACGRPIDLPEAIAST